MRFSEPLESQRLLFLLEKAASREAQLWKGYVSKQPSDQDTHVSPVQRDEAVRWLTDVHSSSMLYPETLSLAVCVLDRFLAIVKARPKYLRCIAIACFFLAAKTTEEDECIPSLRELTSTSRCGCSPSEVLRMERIILDKLNWDLHMPTSLHFLQIFHAMVLLCKSQFLTSLLGMDPSQHLSLLTRQLHRCLSEHTLVQVKGSMLALALITLELEKCCPDWLALTIELLTKAQIDSSQLIRCREMVTRILFPHQASLPPTTVYIYQPPKHLPSTPAPRRQRVKHSTKRKVEEMEVDDFYDGIKRLYNEESGQEGAPEGQGLPCSASLVRQEGNISPCPPLRPVSVT